MPDPDPFAVLRLVEACDGCGREGATETLWLNAPLGLTAVHVHRDRSCAEQARLRKGGGKYKPTEQSA